MFDRRPKLLPRTAPGRRVDATVKWFNASKVGFVTLSGGTQDAFLPMATLRRAGYEDVAGASLPARSAPTPRDPSPMC
jgi:hypothetical protein